MNKNKSVDETVNKMEKEAEEKVDKVLKSKAMQTKVGKLSLGEYLTYNKKSLTVTLILIIVLGILSLIPLIGWFFWIIYLIAFWLSALYITFMLGYKLAKDGRTEIKEALIGGALLGALYGVIHAIFTLVFQLMSFYVFSAYVTGYFLAGAVILTIIWIVIGSIVGGLIVSLIGFAVAGGFNTEDTGNQGASKTKKE